MRKLLSISLGCAAIIAAVAGYRLSNVSAQSAPDMTRIKVTCTNCSGKFANYGPQMVEPLNGINEVEASQCFKNYFIEQSQAHKITEMEKRDDGPGRSTCSNPQAVITPMDVNQIYTDVTTARVETAMEIEGRFHGSNCGLEGTSRVNQFSVRDSLACSRNYTPALRGSLMAHEITHRLSYAHCSNSNYSDDNTTVPYTVKHAIEKCWDQRLPLADNSPIK